MLPGEPPIARVMRARLRPGPGNQGANEAAAQTHRLAGRRKPPSTYDAALATV
jgi:hypothetical protein